MRTLHSVRLNYTVKVFGDTLARLRRSLATLGGLCRVERDIRQIGEVLVLYRNKVGQLLSRRYFIASALHKSHNLRHIAVDIANIVQRRIDKRG